VLGEQVGGIYLAVHLAEVHPAEADRLLNPQGVGIQMTKLAKALSVTDADGRAGVSPHAQARAYSEVAE